MVEKPPDFSADDFGLFGGAMVVGFLVMLFGAGILYAIISTLIDALTG